MAGQNNSSITLEWRIWLVQPWLPNVFDWICLNRRGPARPRTLVDSGTSGPATLLIQSDLKRLTWSSFFQVYLYEDYSIKPGRSPVFYSTAKPENSCILLN